MIDVHVIKHPTQDRSETLYPMLELLDREPVNVHLVDGVAGHIGKGRRRGFETGTQRLCTYIDDDDKFIPGIFDQILECFEKEPEIHALCTRERRTSGNMATIARFPYKYYDKRHLFRIHHLSVFRRDKIAPYLPELDDLPDSSEHYLCARLLLDNAIFRHLPVVGYEWNLHENDSKSLHIPKPEKANEVFRELRNQSHRELLKPHAPGQELLKFVA